MSNKHWLNKKLLITLVLFFSLGMFFIPNTSLAYFGEGTCACFHDDSCDTFDSVDGVLLFPTDDSCVKYCNDSDRKYTKVEKTERKTSIEDRTLLKDSCAKAKEIAFKQAEEAKNPTAGSAIGSLVTPKPFVTPRLETPIPNLTFSKPFESGGKVTVNFISEYINAVYKFIIPTSVILAIVMIIIGGIQYIVSPATGMTKGAKGAKGSKERISNAVIGLVLLLSVYLILYTVNPSLTILRPLTLTMIPKPDPVGADAHPQNEKEEKMVAGKIGSKQILDEIKSQKNCSSLLDENKRSKPSNPAYINNPYFGALDCKHSGGSRELSSIKVIGIHEGKMQGGVTWWIMSRLKGGYGISTHYFIAKNGDIQQVMGENLIAHHGIYNKTSIGIDLEICPAGIKDSAITSLCKVTDDQYKSLNELIKDIKGRTNVNRIIGHCERFDRRGKRVDPRMFDWKRIKETPSNHQNGNCVWSPHWVNDEFLKLGPKR